MQSCASCKKTARQKLALLCGHVLCLACSEQLKRQEQKDSIEPRYRLQCPTCKRATLTYSLMNLLAGSEESRRLLNQPPFESEKTAIVAQRSPSRNQKVGTPLRNKRKKSICAGKEREREQQLRCRKHNRAVQYYNPTLKKLLCRQCKECLNETGGKNVLIEGARDLLQKDARGFKEQAKQRLQEVDLNLSILERNEKALSKARLECLERIKRFGEEVKQQLEQRYNYLLKWTQQLFALKSQQLQAQLKDFKSVRGWLQDATLKSEGRASMQLLNEYPIFKRHWASHKIKQRLFQQQQLSLVESEAGLGDLRKVLTNMLHLRNEKGLGLPPMSVCAERGGKTLELKRPQSQMNNYPVKKTSRKASAKTAANCKRKNSLR